MKTITLNIDGKEIKATITAEDAAKITEWPQVGDEYFRIEAGDEIGALAYRSDSYDRSLMKMGNMYRARQEAEAEVRARKLIAAIQRRRKELNGDWVPDWLDGNMDKHMIYMAPVKGELGVTCAWITDSAPVFGHFRREEDAFAVIDEFDDELIWYFTEYANS